MSGPKGIRRIFRLSAFLPSPAKDVDEELDLHFLLTQDELMAEGLSPTEAREEAHRRFGDRSHYRQELEKLARRRSSRAQRGEILSVLGQDTRYAFRGMGRNPGFTAAVVLTLALGIGANATMFGVLDRLFLSPPAHVEDADAVRRLLINRVWPFSPDAMTTPAMTYPDFLDFREAGSFREVAAFSDQEMVLGRGPEARRVNVQLASPSFFPLLGVRPALGRFFDEAEDRPGIADVTILSYGFWQAEFGGSPDAIGSTLAVGKGSYTVIGVAPQGFTGVDLGRVDLWLPVHAFSLIQGTDQWREAKSFYFLGLISRLGDGVGDEAAEAEATAILLNGRRELIDQGRYPDDAKVLAASVIAAEGPNQPGEVAVSRWLAGVTLIVLLIACANVANLLLARGARRRRELGIRLAMGISRRRLVEQLLLESLLLAAMGGGAGLMVAYLGGDLMRAFLLPDVAWVGSPVDGRVILFTSVLAILTGLLAGVAPAWQATRSGIVSSLKEGGRDSAFRRSRSQVSLLVAQGALSVVLLTGAGLFVLSLHRAGGQDLGFEPQGLGLAQLEFEDGVENPEVWEIYHRSLERIGALPGVQEASLSTVVPFDGLMAVSLFVPGLDSIPAPPRAGPWMSHASADHFATLRMPIVEGRGFTAAEVRADARVALVTRNMAQGIWGPSGALGECFKLNSPDEPCFEVVGVVEDSHLTGVVDQERWQYFLPAGPRLAEAGPTPNALFFRVEGDGNGILSSVQTELRGLDARITFATVRPFQDYVDSDLRSWTLGRTMFGGFGLLALLVASIGLYSVLAFNVARRRQEIGVRSALGASRASLVGMIMREATVLTTLGILLGLGITLLAGGKLEPLLFETSPKEPVVLLGVALVLLLGAGFSGALPAWIAGKTDPVKALKTE